MLTCGRLRRVIGICTRSQDHISHKSWTVGHMLRSFDCISFLDEVEIASKTICTIIVTMHQCDLEKREKVKDEYFSPSKLASSKI